MFMDTCIILLTIHAYSYKWVSIIVYVQLVIIIIIHACIIIKGEVIVLKIHLSQPHIVFQCVYTYSVF